MIKIILVWVLLMAQWGLGQGIWTKTFEDSEGTGSFTGVIATQDGNYIAHGSFNTGHYATSTLIVKYNADGIVLWAKKYPQLGGAVAGIELSNGDLLFGGVVEDSTFNPSPILMRTDGSGEQVWYNVLTYDNGYGFILGLTLLSDGTILTCGDSSGQLNVMNMSSDGDVIFNYTLGDGRGYDLVPAWDGGG